MSFSHSGLIEVRKSHSKGRGVFARVSIPKGMIIERVPVIVFPVGEIYTDTKNSKLADYVFNWGDDKVMVALGYGSLYNHSFQPNAEYYSGGKKSQVYSALRDIKEDEEITINYNGSYKDRSKVAFDVVD